MTRRTPKDIIPLLEEWEARYRDWMTQYEALQALTKCGPEAPIALAMGRMFDAYSAAVSREVGDTSDWLEWYCWENDMGAKGLEVESLSGRAVKVRTVKQLARVICS